MAIKSNSQEEIIDEAEVLAVLNEAFDDWGCEDLLQWKYSDFPEYDPDEHIFSITVDNDVVAVRRVFRKELVVDGETIPIHIYGDTAVKPKYQGNGLYSKLCERTKEYSEQSDAKYIAAFNRKGNLTFDSNIERGWSYKTLSLQLRILSPRSVLKTYASLVTDNLPLVNPIAAAIGHRLHIGTSDGQLTFNEIISEENCSNGRSIGPVLSDTAVNNYVEAVSTDGNTVWELITTSVRLVANRDVSIGQSFDSGTHIFEGYSNEIDITVEKSVTESDLKALTMFSEGTPSFRRTYEDIEHLIQYPNSKLFIARHQGRPVGYAVLSPYENNNVVEGRILEMQTKDENQGTIESLLTEIERYAVENQFDLLLILSENELGDQWVKVDQQVLVWNELEQVNKQPLQRDDLQISFYDIV